MMAVYEEIDMKSLVRRLADEFDLTIHDLANLLDISERTLRHMVSPKGNPSRQTMTLLAVIYIVAKEFGHETARLIISEALKMVKHDDR